MVKRKITKLPMYRTAATLTLHPQPNQHTNKKYQPRKADRSARSGIYPFATMHVSNMSHILQ